MGSVIDSFLTLLRGADFTSLDLLRLVLQKCIQKRIRYLEVILPLVQVVENPVIIGGSAQGGHQAMMLAVFKNQDELGRKLVGAETCTKEGVFGLQRACSVVIIFGRSFNIQIS
jgi:hypothetical protein